MTDRCDCGQTAIDADELARLRVVEATAREWCAARAQLDMYLDDDVERAAEPFATGIERWQAAIDAMIALFTPAAPTGPVMSHATTEGET